MLNESPAQYNWQEGSAVVRNFGRHILSDAFYSRCGFRLQVFLLTRG
jgi:hypothetical protein